MEFLIQLEKEHLLFLEALIQSVHTSAYSINASLGGNRMEQLRLRRFTDEDIPLFSIWLNKEYILKWYEDPDAWLAEIKGRTKEFSFITHFIVLYEGKPIGFCQYYPCANAGEVWYGEIPAEGSYSLDYLIGEEEYLGKGLGKGIIQLLTDKVFQQVDAERIIVQPESENGASCRALLASGFCFDERNQLYCRNKE
ncbi:MAG: acetyltransferase [Bacillota bacterium]|nr:acetyltransferase [Bacillota bacterium]